MPIVALSQQNFNGGEYSLGLKQRFDLQAYYKGLERMSNFFPTKEGNAKFRTGTEFLRETEVNNKTRYLEFVVSNSERYLLEFSDLVLRVFRDGIQIGGDIVSPYREVDLFNIHKAQENSIMILVDGIHPPYRLVKSDILFTLTLESFNNGTDGTPPFLSENLTAVTVDPSGKTGTVTIVASSPLFNIFDVGRYIRIRDGSASGFARITIFTSDVLVTAEVIEAFDDANAHATWSLSAIPAAVTFYEQRLIYGQLNKLWFSKNPDDDGIVRYNDFTIGTAVDDALQYESGLLRGEISWLVATERVIAIGTYTGTFKADSGELNEAISPTTPPTIKKISGIGSSNVMPFQSDNVVFFVSRDNRRIHSMLFSFENDGYIVTDQMLLSNEIAQEGITQITFFQGEGDFLLATKTNGELIGLLFSLEQQVNGWFRFKATDGEIESVASIPQSNGKDRVFLSIKRTINSLEKRYVEFISDEIVLPNRDDFFTGDEKVDDAEFLFDTNEAQKDFVFLDSSLKFDGSDQSVTMTPGAKTGLGITFIAGGALFVVGDIGREIWEKSGNGRATITGFTSGTEVVCNIISDFASTTTLIAGDWYFTSDNFTGLDHLEGESVNAIIDGGRDPNTYVVVSGEITIAEQASKTTIGLSYIGLLKTMGLEGGSNNGTSRNKTKIVDKMGIYFLNSVGAKVGTSLYALNLIPFGPSQILGRAITVFTGVKEVDLAEVPEKDKHIYILQDAPLPCIIQAILPLLEATSE